MIPSHVLQELLNILGSRHLITDQPRLADYSSDGTKMEFMPDAVAFPGSDKDISNILVLANKEKIPVIPRGAGSGMSGGALPVKGGLVLAMDRFNKILSIDKDNLIAKVEPGVIGIDFQKEVERIDLFYPPDPASIDVATIGGNVAECAGGLRAVKYGVTRDYVLGLKVVLPTGEVIKTGVETAKGVAGYDLTRLIVGSEGTLAVITSVTLRLLPKPEAKKTMLVFFTDVTAAVKSVSSIIRGKVIPTTLEFLDKLCIDCVRDEMGIEIPVDTGAMLLIEVDGDEELVIRDSKKVREICNMSGASSFQIASNDKDVERLWKARREASPSLMKLRPGKISEDVVVPRSRLPELISFLSKLSKKYGLPIPAFGHAGDGNIHVNIMLDKSDPEEMKSAESVIKELFEKVITMGGTITGEHGVGITKSLYMGIEFSTPALDLMRNIKKTFDPNDILNPGKIFPV